MSSDSDSEQDFLNPNFLDVMNQRQPLNLSTPVAFFGMKVAGGGKRISACEETDEPLPFRLTMAAIDGSEQSNKACTLRVIRRPFVEADDEEISEEELAEAEEELVLCTLKAGHIYQQVLDISFGDDEQVYFTASGDW